MRESCRRRSRSVRWEEAAAGEWDREHGGGGWRGGRRRTRGGTSARASSGPPGSPAAQAAGQVTSCLCTIHLPHLLPLNLPAPFSQASSSRALPTPRPPPLCCATPLLPCAARSLWRGQAGGRHGGACTLARAGQHTSSAPLRSTLSVWMPNEESRARPGGEYWMLLQSIACPSMVARRLLLHLRSVPTSSIDSNSLSRRRIASSLDTSLSTVSSLQPRRQSRRALARTSLLCAWFVRSKGMLRLATIFQAAESGPTLLFLPHHSRRDVFVFCHIIIPSRRRLAPAPGTSLRLVLQYGGGPASRRGRALRPDRRG